MLSTPIKNFDDLLKVVDSLSPEQKQVLRQHIDNGWANRFGKALADIHADMPNDFVDEEIQADIEAAIRDVRAKNS